MSGNALGAAFRLGGAGYEQHRPGFPAECADWLIPEGARHVLDLGAGTGKFTELLAGRYRSITAVEPSQSMLDQLAAKLPGVDAVPGTAESIPLPDSSVDAVVVAQAFHWFDRDAAAADIARVLTAGGRLGLAWNSSDGSQDWETQATEAFYPGSTRSHSEPFATLPGFRPAEERTLGWSEAISRQNYLNRWRTVSRYLAASKAERAELIGRVESILDEHSETSGSDMLTLRQQTYCVRMDSARRSG